MPCFNREVVTELQKYGLTPGQPKVLDYLFDHDGAMQKEIALKNVYRCGNTDGNTYQNGRKRTYRKKNKNGNRRSFIFTLRKKVGKKPKM